MAGLREDRAPAYPLMVIFALLAFAVDFGLRALGGETPSRAALVLVGLGPVALLGLFAGIHFLTLPAPRPVPPAAVSARLLAAIRARTSGRTTSS